MQTSTVPEYSVGKVGRPLYEKYDVLKGVVKPGRGESMDSGKQGGKARIASQGPDHADVHR